MWLTAAHADVAQSVRWVGTATKVVLMEGCHSRCLLQPSPSILDWKKGNSDSYSWLMAACVAVGPVLELPEVYDKDPWWPETAGSKQGKAMCESAGMM
jgi:hypothetical protein